MTDWIALAKVAFAAAQKEDLTQLVPDVLTLWSAEQKIAAGALPESFTEDDLNSIIPAFSRTGIVIGDIWGDTSKRATIMAALKGLGT